MNLNSDFSQRVLLHSDALEWERSPMAGVERRRLDRVYGENDRVTTIVRYAPGSQFSAHVHEGGEEFIVLEGVFEDDYGDWPAGSYIRNPPQSRHTPGSTHGCTILVKLWQFQADDRTFVHAQMDKLGSVRDLYRPSVHVSPLYQDRHEYVRVERYDASGSVNIEGQGGAEIFVLDGSVEQGGETLRRHSWLRMPVDAEIRLNVGPRGARVWIKSGHLIGL